MKIWKIAWIVIIAIAFLYWTADFFYLSRGIVSSGENQFAGLSKGGYCYLMTALIVSGVAFFAAIIMGYITGYNRSFASRFIESVFLILFESIPTMFLLIIVFLAYSEQAMQLYVIWTMTLGLIFSAKVLRVINTKIAILRRSGFIMAAEELGLSHLWIYLKHILWYNLKPDFLVQGLGIIKGVIYTEVLLSLIRLSPFSKMPGFVSWGQMLYDKTDGTLRPLAMGQVAQWWIPLLGIFLSVFLITLGQNKIINKQLNQR